MHGPCHEQKKQRSCIGHGFFSDMLWMQLVYSSTLYVLLYPLRIALRFTYDSTRPFRTWERPTLAAEAAPLAPGWEEAKDSNTGKSRG